MQMARVAALCHRLGDWIYREPRIEARSDVDALEAMLKRAGILANTGGGKTGRMVSLGTDSVFHHAVTDGNFMQFDFDGETGQLLKVGLWQNWCCDPTVPPMYGWNRERTRVVKFAVDPIIGAKAER